MSDNKKILSLYYGEGLSQRKIAERTGISRNTISPVCKRADELKLDIGRISPMSYEELDHLLFPERKFIPSYVIPDFDYVHKELLKPGTTLMMLYEEYVESCKKEKLPYYKKTQFYDLYADHVKKNRLTMHINHKPADKVEVDWFGTTMEVYDQYTGEVYTAYLFCGTLPFSMLSFIYACPDMKIANWIDCHIRMFEYFGGVPRLLIPDNLKVGVKSNRKYEDPVLNRSYQEMADHYGVTIIPARVRAPKDKAAAEGAVGDGTYTIIGHLRNRKFFSFDELNKAIAIELEKFNDRPFQKKDGSRRSVYEDEEKPFMKSLAAYPFELSSWKKATVQLNYHIQVDKMNYSVPYEYVGKRVDVKVSKDLINIYYSGLQIASHKRLYGRRNQYATIELHMPENHKLYEWNGDRFLMWAKNIGPHTYEVIDRHIRRYHVEEQSYKGCISILKLSDKYTALRLENACQLALQHIPNPTYKNIRLILEAGQDEKKEAESTNNDHLNDHALIRGSSYYGGKK